MKLQVFVILELLEKRSFSYYILKIPNDGTFLSVYTDGDYLFRTLIKLPSHEYLLTNTYGDRLEITLNHKIIL